MTDREQQRQEQHAREEVPFQQDPDIDLSFNHRQGIVWSFLADFVHRHANRDLRVALHSPCSQYVTWGVWEGAMERQVLDINPSGSSFLVEEHHQYRWPALLLSHERLTRVEKDLGWTPRATKARKASHLAIAVIAELAKRYALADHPLVIRSSHQPGGWGGGEVQPWGLRLPGLSAALHAAGDTPSKRMAAMARGVGFGDPGDVAVVIDLPSGGVFRPDGKREYSLTEAFGKGAGVREMAWRVEGLWRG